MWFVPCGLPVIFYSSFAEVIVWVISLKNADKLVIIISHL
jgi:hypothetical protein